MSQEMQVGSESSNQVFSFTGTGTQMALVMLKNLFFTIITLGIYRAWAKTNMRRFVWGNVQFMGDRGSYVGTGGELFRGWIKLFGLLFAFLVVSAIIKKLFPFLVVPLTMLAPFAYLLLFSIAIYAGRRYRMSRTLWRQIRFGVDKDKESTKEFTKLYFKGVLLSFITLGLYAPVFSNQLRTYLTNKSRFGTAYFKFDGDSAEYWKLVVKGFLLSIVTLGIYAPWFFVNLMRFKLKHTEFQGSCFECTLDGKDMFICGIVAYVGVIFTAGLASPWIFAWVLSKIIGSIQLNGTLDLSTVRQQASDGSALADDIVAEYDLDLGF